MRLCLTSRKPPRTVDRRS